MPQGLFLMAMACPTNASAPSPWRVIPKMGNPGPKSLSKIQQNKETNFAAPISGQSRQLIKLGEILWSFLNASLFRALPKPKMAKCK